MSKPLAGTKTEKNLWTAFAGESQARNKYDYFAGVARKEGFQQIAATFEKRLLTKSSRQDLVQRTPGHRQYCRKPEGCRQR